VIAPLNRFSLKRSRSSEGVLGYVLQSDLQHCGHGNAEANLENISADQPDVLGRERE
jgi:hypothetical protein